MTPMELFDDINTGCLTEVVNATNYFYDANKGLTVCQKFYLYPDEIIVCLNAVDGGYEIVPMTDEAVSIFNAIYLPRLTV